MSLLSAGHQVLRTYRSATFSHSCLLHLLDLLLKEDVHSSLCKTKIHDIKYLDA